MKRLPSLLFLVACLVATYMASTGIDLGVITAEGRGSKEPIADNTTAEVRGKNRRVQVLITFH